MEQEFRYQQYAREKILARQKTAVIAVPGAGKTRPIIDALNEMGLLDGHHRVLLLCTGPAAATWVRQIPQWCGRPELVRNIHIVRGAPGYRQAVWEVIGRSGGIAITNSAVFLRDRELITRVGWDVLAADEYHKFMRRRQSQTYKQFLKMSRHTHVVVLATGSVISRDPSSMFTAFQIVDPKYFSSYWRFVNTFCLVDETPFGKDIIGPKNLAALRETMDRYLAYIPEEVIADQLPEGRRQAVDVEMTEEQSKIYAELSDNMLSILDSGDLIITPNALTLLVRLRQLLCCPRALDQSLGMGGGYEWLADQFSTEEHPYCVVFVPFRRAAECIYDELTADGYETRLLMGGMDHNEVKWAVDSFRERASEGCIIVCTIQFAESFDLEKCATSYFLGYDYSLDQNKQAEGRTRRAISEHKFVQWNYLRYANTIDETLVQKLNEDAVNVRRVLERPAALIAALKGETK